MYAGNMGALQGLEPLIDAFAQCPNVHLALVGDGVERKGLEQRSRTLEASNIRFISSQSQDHIGLFLQAADVQVVSLGNTPLLRATMPSKVQVALATGRPVLAHAAGDVSELIGATGSGLCVPPGDVVGLVDAITKFEELTCEELFAMGTLALQTYQDMFSEAVGVSRLEGLLDAFPQGPSRHAFSRSPIHSLWTDVRLKISRHTRSEQSTDR